MGALILVSGANGSGKSLFAEELVSKTQGERFYIATMVPQTEENHNRIEKHRRQRKGLNFTTLELPVQVGDASVQAGAVVLLEDVSNLLANVVFGSGGTAEDVYQDICKLADRSKLLIAVTITDLCAENYQDETAAYISSLALLNQKLFHSAAAAVEMKGGEAFWQKGTMEILT